MSTPEGAYHEQLWRDDSSTVVDYRPGLNLRLDAAIKLIQPGTRLLDVGCGAGVLGRAVRARFEQTFGVDVSATAVGKARELGNVVEQVNLNTAALPYPDEYFDTVTALVVLYMLYDPGSGLAECKRVLRRDGDLIVSLPNMRAWWRVLRLAVQGTFPRTSTHRHGNDGGALHYYCFKDMRALLEGHGFDLMDVWGVCTIPAVAALLPNRGPLGWLKREWLSAEVVVRARRR